jgi:hypothetical protein
MPPAGHVQNSTQLPADSPEQSIPSPQEAKMNASDPPTIVPDSNTLSTRPTREGIAYPFKLKVDKDESDDINLSTVTLNSLKPDDGMGETANGVKAEEANGDATASSGKADATISEGNGIETSKLS